MSIPYESAVKPRLISPNFSTPSIRARYAVAKKPKRRLAISASVIEKIFVRNVRKEFLLHYNNFLHLRKYSRGHFAIINSARKLRGLPHNGIIAAFFYFTHKRCDFFPENIVHFYSRELRFPNNKLSFFVIFFDICGYCNTKK